MKQKLLRRLIALISYILGTLPFIFMTDKIFMIYFGIGIATQTIVIYCTLNRLVKRGDN